MKRCSGEALTARKQPRQARARLTVDAIFEATIQVLLSKGLSALTTTRVAERAGVSVGTLYQYFPQKQALLFALLQRHLEAVADAVSATCTCCLGMSLGDMSDALVKGLSGGEDAGYCRHTGTLYGCCGKLDTDDLLGTIAQRNHAAIRTLLLSAEDATFDRPDAVAFNPSCDTRRGDTRCVGARCHARRSNRLAAGIALALQSLPGCTIPSSLRSPDIGRPLAS